MRVLNRHRLTRWPTGAIYIGRGHPLGNPYRIGPDGTREAVIEKYRRWIESCLKTGDPKIVEAFRYLRRDTDLVCSCAPRPCHGDVVRTIWEREFADRRPLVFVFGANLAGRHGMGAAKFAKMVCGATPGCGAGPQGSAYAIPTEDARLRPLPIPVIAVYVRRFLDYAAERPEIDFKVTAIGCGSTGYEPRHIAPMFAAAPDNCQLPDSWKETLMRWRGLSAFPVRLLVGGSRSIRNRDQIVARLDHLTRRFDLSQVALISGGAQGVDDLAEGWARRRNVKIFRFDPLWRDIGVPGAVVRHGSVGKRYNLRAGMDRNAWMLACATHAAFFWDGSSAGTKQAIDLAKKMQIVHRIGRITPDHTAAPVSIGG